MKKLTIIVFAAIAVFAFTSANAQSTDVKSSGTAVLSAYYSLKNALVAGSVTTANTKAKELMSILGKFQDSKLQAGEQNTWTKYSAKLQMDARHISESNNLAHQREHFESLSQNMFAVVKGLKFNTAAVYKQYCPMKKAYWLSESPAIKNPYFGDNMLDCGEVKETLKPAVK